MDYFNELNPNSEIGKIFDFSLKIPSPLGDKLVRECEVCERSSRARYEKKLLRNLN